MRFLHAGFLMLSASALERDPNIGEEELLDVLSSNLCRCTGYQNIIKAVRAAQAEMRPPEPAVADAPKAEIDPAQEETSAAPEMLEQS
jgi:xanthine dehydrogenase iron-sulfur cluster and FAD-binding subunit A